jgi:hypothetical protein
MSKKYLHCFWKNLVDFSWLKLSTFNELVTNSFAPDRSRAIDVWIGVFVLLHITSKLAVILLLPIDLLVMFLDRAHLTIDLCLIISATIALVTNTMVTHFSLLLSFLSTNILGYSGPQAWSKSNGRQ